MASFSFLGGPAVLDPIGSVLSITNAPQGGGLDWTYQMQGGWYIGARSYTNKMIVVTSSPLVDPVQIQQALIGIGAVQGTTYRFPLPELQNGVITQVGPVSVDTGSFLHSLSIKPSAEDTRQWICEFGYGPFDVAHELGTSQTSSGSVNPLEAAPVVQWNAAEYEESRPTDVNGIPFLNTVGDVLENPPKCIVSRQTLEFVRNEATYSDSYAQKYRQKTNSDSFLGFGPNQAKCKNINGERLYTADWGYYWRVTYSFEFRVLEISTPETYDPITGLGEGDGTSVTYGWEDIVINAGFNTLVGTTLTRILINGQPCANPQALNQDGSVLNMTWTPGGEMPEPFYLVFSQYQQMPFADLNIPSDILTTSQ
jgi:hypothetical protein